jgi:dinuclear metal center YbgI/SA1388 family protein
MLLSNLLQILDEIAPTRLAESWDNVGLLVGDPAQSISRALLAIDYTPQVAAEAAEQRCELVIAYHPPIFNAVKRITAPGLLFDAIRHGIAIYSPHTALDVADGGTNDLLADVLGLRERQPLRLIEPKARAYKLVTFVPEADVERVASALFDAGAGRIGQYTRCSFRTAGTGTFMGDESTNPTVGEKCVYEQAPELKIETVCPIARLTDVLAALRASHPYEEPAFDLVQLAAPPEKLGQGRIGTLAPTPLDELIQRIKRELGLAHVLIAKAAGAATITRAACLAGAGREHVKDAIAQKAQLYLTGEIPHHDALAAAAAGVTVIATLHSNSERAVLKRLRDKLTAAAPDVHFHIATGDRDPFQIV